MLRLIQLTTLCDPPNALDLYCCERSGRIEQLITCRKSLFDGTREVLGISGDLAWG